ncbi:MAG: Mth938-like domain-containing protein, partial [Alphaproteobacteria bacterium]|nr:Mth938-like domain-containing protein [Alphaproteobacteria bacterium]
VQGYGEGGFRVSGTDHRGSILILACEVRAWPVTAADKLTAEDFGPVLEAAGAVSLLLLGGGPAPVAVAPDLRDAFRSAGIVLEIMNTGAACRTYNILAGENRPVAAALIAVD